MVDVHDCVGLCANAPHADVVLELADATYIPSAVLWFIDSVSVLIAFDGHTNDVL